MEDTQYLIFYTLKFISDKYTEQSNRMETLEMHLMLWTPSEEHNAWVKALPTQSWFLKQGLKISDRMRRRGEEMRF